LSVNLGGYGLRFDNQRKVTIAIIVLQEWRHTIVNTVLDLQLKFTAHERGGSLYQVVPRASVKGRAYRRFDNIIYVHVAFFILCVVFGGLLLLRGGGLLALSHGGSIGFGWEGF